MRLSSYVTIVATFICAAALCLVAAGFSVTLIEETSSTSVRRELDRAEINWADVEADGLQLFLIGTAPSEASRFKAVTTAGRVVDAARVIDQMEVADREAFAPPRFSIEILRNDTGISLIGLVPASSHDQQLKDKVVELAGDGTISDLLEPVDYPSPQTWAGSMKLGLVALEMLPRSKISIDASNVSITAMADSETRKRSLEIELRRRVPEGVKLSLNILAPRPVISPFTLRFLIDETGPRFDSCSAESDASAATILDAAKAAGLSEKAACKVGLGVPTQQWSRGTSLAIAKLAELGGGSVTFSDADITLIAPEGTSQAIFDRIVGELESGLPEVFALHAVLPAVPDANEGPPEFTATLSPEGQVQLRGRINSEGARVTAHSYTKARFGSDAVYLGLRVDEELPRNWPIRVLAGVEALSKLSNGVVSVQPSAFAVSGNTGDPDANAEIAQLLSEKLGEAETFSIDVTYLKKLDPVLGLPTHDECEAQLAELQKDRKISFEPGSDTLDASAKDVMDDIAELLKKCSDIKLEVAGHTDSQGRETMNAQLSQSRAQSVVNALRDRRVLEPQFTAKGYGEETPIADNGTAEGREANRRIEFKLIRPEPIAEEPTTLESITETAEPAAETAKDTQDE